ncbi:hypothetical protein [Pyrococcus sp. ST04]|uniref:hypothetical protein n=1 Tax=Pyrococcus sp. ST04 TaxID=1183377 RepID=UPI00026058C9|nr:hypothetical protein [Pyrococcus sp. ST04]AFK22217.1 hypothetical protein Py04_0615 [Pyrococcus sp. ST04]
MDVREIILLAKKGMIDEALRQIEKLSTIDKVLALAEIGKIVGNVDFIDDALYILEKYVEDNVEKILGYGEIASALMDLGFPNEGSEYFDKALSLLDKVDPLNSGISAMFLANKLAKAGFYDVAMETFEYAFDTIMDLELEISKKTDLILQLADVMERTGDDLPSDVAIPFYERAHDIFDKLKIGHRAGIVEKKIELARTLKFLKDPEIRKLVYEGRFNQAIYRIYTKFPRKSVGIGLLEISLWAKKNNMPEKVELLEKALGEISIDSLSDKEKLRVVEIFIDLAMFDKALEVAEKIEDQKIRDMGLVKIGKRLLEIGEIDAVTEIILPKIKGEEFKKELVSQLRE